MPKAFIHFTFFFLVLTALSGVGMRMHPLFSTVSFPYDNVLHAHSHLAILGWTFLGVFIIFLKIFWKQMKKKSEAKILVIILFLTTLMMFIAFLYQSYDIYSIVLSTLHIFIEYWVISFVYRVLKSIKLVPKAGKLFIYGSLISLFLSTIGPFALGYISGVGLKGSHWFDIAIYFYLHFQYNGWLFLMLIGLFVILLTLKGIRYNQNLLLIGFSIYVIALIPNFFASVLWASNNLIIYYIAIIGTIGQWLGVLCILFSFVSIITQLHKYEKQITKYLLLFVFMLLFAKSTMELGLIVPDLGSLVFETRSVIIGYLHFTLLGYVSLFIFVQYIMTHVLSINKFTNCGLLIFIIGFSINEILLFTQGLMTWLSLGAVVGYLEGLLLASGLLLAGIIVLWISFIENDSHNQLNAIND